MWSLAPGVNGELLVDEPTSDVLADLGIPGDFACVPDLGEQPPQVGGVKHGTGSIVLRKDAGTPPESEEPFPLSARREIDREIILLRSCNSSHRATCAASAGGRQVLCRSL
jgi:hypothetical protein